jgi:hypothetical protein
MSRDFKPIGVWARNVSFTTRFDRWKEATRLGLVVDYLTGDVCSPEAPWLRDTEAIRLAEMDLIRFEAALNNPSNLGIEIREKRQDETWNTEPIK